MSHNSSVLCRVAGRSIQALGALATCAVLLTATDVSSNGFSWNNKPIASWTDDDARQILTSSPWAKATAGRISRLMTEFERRDGGNLGQEHGVGYDGVDKRSPSEIFEDYFKADGNGSSSRMKPLPLEVRWESALPVRVAELRAHVVPPPLDADQGYMIAVYGVPGGSFNGDPQRLGDPLKKQAVLKREGKEDVKPSSVEVFQQADGLAVVYVFPPSAEITKADGIVRFEAMIGRIGVVQIFDVREMELQNKLEL